MYLELGRQEMRARKKFETRKGDDPSRTLNSIFRAFDFKTCGVYDCLLRDLWHYQICVLERDFCITFVERKNSRQEVHLGRLGRGTGIFATNS